jgi:hypothetical protein
MFDSTYKSIAQLQLGDRVAAPTESDIVLMLDSHPSRKGVYECLCLNRSNHCSSLHY